MKKRPFDFKYYFDNKNYGTGLRYLTICILILAISVAFNIAVNALPIDGMYKDITLEPVRKLSQETKNLLDKKTNEINIYHISKEDAKSDITAKLLHLYEEESDNITVTYLNPIDEYKFIEQYSNGMEIENNGIIVCSGDRHKILQYSDYVHGSAFKLEDYLNSAIEYVSGEDLIPVYQLVSDHSTKLGETTVDNMTLDGFEVLEIQLEDEEIPDDCSCLILNGITSDLSDKETEKIVKYINNGGDIFLSTDYTETIMSNVNSIVNLYGASFGKGVVAESNSQRYAVDNAVNVIPTIYEDKEKIITNGVEQAIMHNSMPIVIEETPDVEAQTILEASETAFYAYKNLLTNQLESGEGPFIIGAAFEKKDGANSSKLVWISSAYIANEGVNEYTDGSNITLVMNSICWMGKDIPEASVYSGANAAKYLVISDTERNIWKLVLLLIIPGISALVGAFIVTKRRKK